MKRIKPIPTRTLPITEIKVSLEVPALSSVFSITLYLEMIFSFCSEDIIPSSTQVLISSFNFFKKKYLSPQFDLNPNLNNVK